MDTNYLRRTEEKLKTLRGTPWIKQIMSDLLDWTNINEDEITKNRMISDLEKYYISIIDKGKHTPPTQKELEL